MKKFLPLLFFISIIGYAQKSPFSRTTFTKEISFIRTDTAAGSQSTVIEYPKFIVVVELPFYHDGANRAANLEQDIPKAQLFLEYLQKEYRKPVKYVLSSHWHLHSNSGISPFFASGAKLISTKQNWDYSVNNGLLASSESKPTPDQVIYISKDSTILSNTSFPIQIMYIDETYTNKPTKDFLFFYFPKSKALHAACMCAVFTVDFQQMPSFVYSDRVTDLDRSITSRNLPVTHLIKLYSEYDKEKKSYREPFVTNEYFTEYKKHGTAINTVVKKLSACDQSVLTAKQDSVVSHLVTTKTSGYILNSTVYDCMKQKEYAKAVEWARILNIVYPGEANYIDTMGEACLNAGDIAMATHYSNVLKRLDAKNFPDAVKSWEAKKH